MSKMHDLAMRMKRAITWYKGRSTVVRSLLAPMLVVIVIVGSVALVYNRLYRWWVVRRIHRLERERASLKEHKD